MTSNNFYLNLKEINNNKITKISALKIFKIETKINNIDWSHDGKYWAINGDSNKISILYYNKSLNNWEKYKDIQTTGAKINNLLFHHNNSNFLYYTTDEKFIKCIDIYKRQNIFCEQIKDTKSSIYINENKNCWVLLEKKQRNILKFYHIKDDFTLVFNKNFELKEYLNINDVKFYENKILICTNYNDYSILIYDYDTLKLINNIYGHKNNTKKLLINNNKLYSFGDDNIINIINLKENEIENSISQIDNEIIDFDIKNDIIVISSECSILFYQNNYLIPKSDLNILCNKILFNPKYSIFAVLGEDIDTGLILYNIN